MIDLLDELELLVVVLMPHLASGHVNVLPVAVDQHLLLQTHPVVNVQLAGLNPLPGVLEHIDSRPDGHGGDFAGQNLQVRGVGVVLQVEAGEVSPMCPDSVEFVVGSNDGGEVECPILEDDFIPQLVDGLHVLFVQEHLLPLADHRLFVLIELIAAQVPLLRSQKVQPIRPKRQQSCLDGYFQGLVDGHVPGIPQLDRVLVAPLPVQIPLEVPHAFLLESLRLVGDEGVVMGAGSDEGDDLPGLVLDDDSMGGFGLLLVQRKQMFILLIFVALEVVHLDVGILFLILLVHLPDRRIFHLIF